MNIQEQINKDLTKAMKEGKELEKEVLRSIKSAFTNFNVSSGRKPDADLNDEEALSVITKQAKQRKDSLEQFSKAGREDLAEKERQELSIIEDYLPEALTADEIKKIVEEKQEELGVSDMSGMGTLMGAVMKEVKSRAEGNTVKEIVEEVLQS